MSVKLVHLYAIRNTKVSYHSVTCLFCYLQMHVVNFNSKYENFTMAVNESDGLAILGFWFKVKCFYIYSIHLIHMS